MAMCHGLSDPDLSYKKKLCLNLQWPISSGINDLAGDSIASIDPGI
jgi:hypothetical protein